MAGNWRARRAVYRLALAVSLTVVGGGVSLAEKLPGWSAHGSLMAKGGSERQIGELDLFVPLWQDGNSLFFADLRAQTDDSENLEGNAGFGYRTMRQDWILGAYGFFDWRRSDETGNDFMQGTLGLEAMTEALDLRANVYIPKDREESAPGATEVSIVGGSLQMRAGFERVLPGVDGEVGYRLYGSATSRLEIRAFAGGYYFDAEDYEMVAGPRARLEARLFDIGFLGRGSRFTLGAEVTHDDVRDTDGFAMARLTIPFWGGRRSSRGGLDRRMTDYVVRDVDIVTVAAATGDAEDVYYAHNGIAVGYVSVVAPGSDIMNAASVAGSGDMIIADGTNGAFLVSDSIAMNQGTVLLGGGGSIDLVGADSGLETTWTAPGARPAVAGSVSGGSVISLADDVIVAGLDIENISSNDSSTAVYGNAVEGALVSNNGIATNGNNGYGIFLNTGSGNTITGNSVATNGTSSYSVYVLSSAGNTVSGNSIATNGAFGYGVILNNSFANTVSGNNIATSGDLGFGVILSSSNGNLVTGNTIATTGSTARGLYLFGSNTNTISSNTIQTGLADAAGVFLNATSVVNTGTGNSYTGPAVACVDKGTGNSIDLCP